MKHRTQRQHWGQVTTCPPRFSDQAPSLTIRNETQRLAVIIKADIFAVHSDIYHKSTSLEIKGEKLHAVQRVVFAPEVIL